MQALALLVNAIIFNAANLKLNHAQVSKASNYRSLTVETTDITKGKVTVNGSTTSSCTGNETGPNYQLTFTITNGHWDANLVDKYIKDLQMLYEGNYNKTTGQETSRKSDQKTKPIIEKEPFYVKAFVQESSQFGKQSCSCDGLPNKDSNMLSDDHRVIRVLSLMPVSNEDDEQENLRGLQSAKAKGMAQKLMNPVNFGPNGTIKIGRFEFDDLNLQIIPKNSYGRRVVKETLENTDILQWNPIDEDSLTKFIDIFLDYLKNQNSVALITIKQTKVLQALADLGIKGYFIGKSKRVLQSPGLNGSFGIVQPKTDLVMTKGNPIAKFTSYNQGKPILVDSNGSVVAFSAENLLVFGHSMVSQELEVDNSGLCTHNDHSRFYCNLADLLVSKVQLYRTRNRSFLSHFTGHRGHSVPLVCTCNSMDSE